MLRTCTTLGNPIYKHYTPSSFQNVPPLTAHFTFYTYRIVHVGFDLLENSTHFPSIRLRIGGRHSGDTIRLSRVKSTHFRTLVDSVFLIQTKQSFNVALMAKWGEGDPRWIVEERPDATNVNNWHWTERNASPWSQERMKELFQDIPVANDRANLVIRKVDKMEGEASANNRKGKLIFFYEWNLVLNWEGTLIGGTGSNHTGKIMIPNLSEENNVTELDIQISLDEADEEGLILKDIMYKDSKEIVQHKVQQYIESLQIEFSKGMILPKKDEIKPDTVKTLTSGFNKKINMEPVISSNTNSGLHIETSTIKINQKFQCKAQDFYDAMTRAEMVTAFTRGPVKLEVCKGGKFELFGGNITGVFDELIPNTKIVQQWRYKQWPAGHYSVVTININEKGDHTEVKVVQSGIPKSEVGITKENWERYYWESMKRTFGFGAFIV